MARGETEETKRAKRAAANAQRAIEQHLDRLGIPLRHRFKDVAPFVAGDDKQERAGHRAGDRRELQRCTGLVMSGIPSTGMSQLAIAIAHAVMDGHSALYTSAIDSARMIRNVWRGESPLIESGVLDVLSRVYLLILDEVGVQ